MRTATELERAWRGLAASAPKRVPADGVTAGVQPMAGATCSAMLASNSRSYSTPSWMAVRDRSRRDRASARIAQSSSSSKNSCNRRSGRCAESSNSSSNAVGLPRTASHRTRRVGAAKPRTRTDSDGLDRDRACLLIRGFGVRVPGGAPVLTWCFYRLFSLVGIRFPAMFARRLLVSPDLALMIHDDRPLAWDSCRAA